MDVEVVDYEMFCGEPVSSTRIRCELSAGRIARANAMLGRAFTFSGTVCSGKGVGGAMGFPTLNLKPGKPLFLPFGVYVVQTEFGLAVANWGMAPTMAESAWEEPVFEVHLLDASQLPVGKDVRKMKSQLLAFLRPEKKFDTVEDLLRQIAKDVDAALKFEQSDK
jgi:riboflavin kinase/FMN adenylyltransferase